MDDKIARFHTAFRSERLVYRPIEDTEEVTAFLTELYSDPIVKGLSSFGALKPTTKKDTKDMIKSFEERDVLAVLMCLPPAAPTGGKDDQEEKETIIGFVALSPRWERAVSLGISVLGAYQNSGYGREAINWAMDWAFVQGGYHRLGIGTVEFNERARRLYERLGFLQEGRVRGAAWVDGQWHDVVEYSLLDFEWRKLRGME